MASAPKPPPQTEKPGSRGAKALVRRRLRIAARFVHYSHATYLDHGEVSYVQSVSCPLPARWGHVASSPLPSTQAFPTEI